MDRRARAQLWDRLRLLVLDLETAVAPDGTHRVVSAAAVTCLGGKVTGRWSAPLVNPGVPIDPVTASIHGLTDAHVAGAPPFAAVAAELAPLLRPGLDEDLVLVAHQARFDVPILRAELARVGAALPDLSVLDTMGKLRGLAAVAPADGSLAALLAVLGLRNAKAHTAVADAQATAEAACALLNLAADAGHSNLRDLLAATGDGRTATLRYSGPGGRRNPVEPEIPPAHRAGHAVVLAAKPGKRAIAEWLASVDECASLRCDQLDERVAAALMPAASLLPLLIDRLRATTGTSAAATLAGAILPRLPELPESPRGQRRLARRRAAIELDTAISAHLDARGRCEEPALCPACRRGETCPLDAWRIALARAAFPLEMTRQQAGSFLATTGVEAGTGVYLSMADGGNPDLADACLRVVHRYWISIDQREIANALAHHASVAGCRDPEIAEARAIALASPGRKDDISAAIAECDRVLAHRRDRNDEAWRSLAIRRAQLGGRLRRLGVRYADERDADGNLVVKRRHHPEVPRRSRPPRFHPLVVEEPPA